MDFVYFVVLVGVLVFVHELGHFAWAKFFRVKVLKFSLGFGPRLFGFSTRETEYVVALLPLGGYVKMLGEAPDEEVDPRLWERSFGAQPFWKRFVIVLAGPAMNLVFPLALFFVLFLGHEEAVPPVVGTVYPHRPAEGRLLPGDRVLSIDGEAVQTFDEIRELVGASAGQPLRFTVERRGEEVEQVVTPVATRRVRELDRTDTVGRVGIAPEHPAAVIGVTSPSSPAHADGLRTFDVVASVAGRPVDRLIDLERAVAGTGAVVPITIMRPVRLEQPLGGLVDMDVYEPHVATLTPEPGRGSALLRAGIEPADLYVSRVMAGSPEHLAGLLPGDRVVALDGRPARLWATFVADLEAAPDAEHEVLFRRGDVLHTARFRLDRQRGVTEYGQTFDRAVLNVANWVPMRVDPPVANPRRVRYALAHALDTTGEMIELTLLSVVRLVQGRVSMKSLGGPLSIYEAAGSAARGGTTDYLTTMAFLSVNLGLINLLPVPLLDGGHLLFFLLEVVSRRPLSVRVRQYASLAGLALLLSLLVLAFKNDIERKWPDATQTAAEE